MTREERNVLLFVALGVLLGSLPLRREAPAPGHTAFGVEPGAEPGDVAGAIVRPLFPIDVNRAGVELLGELPGIGPTRAAAIVATREGGGPFRSAEDLRRVKGIGPGTVAKIRDLVTMGDSLAPPARAGEERIVDGSSRDTPH